MGIDSKNRYAGGVYPGAFTQEKFFETIIWGHNVLGLLVQGANFRDSVSADVQNLFRVASRAVSQLTR